MVSEKLLNAFVAMIERNPVSIVSEEKKKDYQFYLSEPLSDVLQIEKIESDGSIQLYCENNEEVLYDFSVEDITIL